MEVGVVGLLRTAWVAATMPILVAAVPCSWLGSFHGAVPGLPREGRSCSRHLSFYTAAPLSLCCNNVLEVYKFSISGVAEFIVKGKSSMREVEFDWLQFVNSLLKLGWLHWIGAAIFFWGWIHQRRCHAILGSLRDHSEPNDEYVIPDGDWFEIVSSPHYLAEIVIYACLVVASGGTDLTIWLLFGFVASNLVLAAAETH